MASSTAQLRPGDAGKRGLTLLRVVSGRTRTSDTRLGDESDLPTRSVQSTFQLLD